MKNKRFDKNHKSSFKKNDRDNARSVEARIKDIMHTSTGQKFVLKGIVDRIVQTGGPTVFHVTDGTGMLALKAFEGAGIRSFSNIKEKDVVKAEVRIEEYRDELEGNIINFTKLADQEKKDFLDQLKNTERERAAITPPEFLIKSTILDKLRNDFIKAATEIRLAIIQNRPIIIRHHNDTDGYSSGFALERAIVPLVEEQHGGGKSAWEFFTRAPCAAPFYEIEDSIKDTAKSLSNEAKFSNKMPLVIISDNGSSQEDLLGIQQGKVHGVDFIVVDHHFFEKDVVSKEVLVHINPFLVGEDGAKFSAGMLCTELARFINPDVKNVEQIAAMAGMADRITLANLDAVEQYVKIAEKHEYSRYLLGDISTVIDFVSSKLRFMEAREYIEVLFGEPKDKQKALVGLMAPYIRNLEFKGLEIAKSAAVLEKIGATSLQLLPIEETFSRGFYPKPGKCTGLLHDYLKEEKKVTNLVTAGVLSDAITMRATDGANFSVHKLIEFLNKKVPSAFVQGGGHKNAGAISFVPRKKEEVLKYLREFIKNGSK
ncbi:hypothetical protein J4408_03535 [Candidatus Pacearchaeota archaeon]|nr:hypothetical protein [Candidatus Pacearchaeota archaeon]